jgi:hypothetical protein
MVVPVVYTDFLGMYSTVNILMGLWPYVISSEIRVAAHCTAEIEAFLRSVTPDDLFQPETWKDLNAFVRIIPDGDILPTRAKYSVTSNDRQVAVNQQLDCAGMARYYSESTWLANRIP